ncbi:hypothetical protein GCM10010129_56820 [Streptomyces fumigatiscleroticus]|nr:hypothetical protein GCM10010129_56820 [Streptomyces fumigatiscleroticus]
MLADQIHTFAELLAPHEDNAGKLTVWINRTRAADLLSPCFFANGLERDRAAVDAALTLPWHNGHVEGANTENKFPKRLMYGRAGHRLLRQVVSRPGADPFHERNPQRAVGRARRRPQAGSFVSMTKLISMTWPGKVSSVMPKTVLAGRWSPKYPGPTSTSVTSRVHAAVSTPDGHASTPSRVARFLDRSHLGGHHRGPRFACSGYRAILCHRFNGPGRPARGSCAGCRGAAARCGSPSSCNPCRPGRDRAGRGAAPTGEESVFQPCSIRNEVT